MKSIIFNHSKEVQLETIFMNYCYVGIFIGAILIALVLLLFLFEMIMGVNK